MARQKKFTWFEKFSDVVETLPEQDQLMFIKKIIAYGMVCGWSASVFSILLEVLSEFSVSLEVVSGSAPSLEVLSASLGAL